jgi:hypothetical protein
MVPQNNPKNSVENNANPTEFIRIYKGSILSEISHLFYKNLTKIEEVKIYIE